MTVLLVSGQTLIEYCSFHVCFGHLGNPWHKNVTASRTVANRESRYPPAGPADTLLRHSSRCRWGVVK